MFVHTDNSGAYGRVDTEMKRVIEVLSFVIHMVQITTK